MLLYPAIRDLLDKVPSRYQLVNLVANRARAISSQAEHEGTPLEEKSVSLAIQEVADGILTPDTLYRKNHPELNQEEEEQDEDQEDRSEDAESGSEHYGYPYHYGNNSGDAGNGAV